ncbi:hypothetical protein FACS189463_1510 [Bacteroidia bacterium]|nr:hypothetical protein FACS189463_1510 [Bacteroidia bacterium]
MGVKDGLKSYQQGVFFIANWMRNRNPAHQRNDMAAAPTDSIFRQCPFRLYERGAGNKKMNGKSGRMTA